MTPEGRVVADIKAAMKDLGGDVRKCQWVGHAGAPDLFIMVPRLDEDLNAAGFGFHLWVEVKAPGKTPEPHQLREHAKMEEAGCNVCVVDSVLDAIDAVQAQYDPSSIFTEEEIERCRIARYKWGQILARREAKNARGKKDTV